MIFEKNLCVPLVISVDFQLFQLEEIIRDIVTQFMYICTVYVTTKEFCDLTKLRSIANRNESEY